MPQRKVPLAPGEYYHVFNRGINSEIVFRSDRNYLFFLRRIRELLIPNTASIIAYVLMPTHYHLLIEIVSETFSAVMGRVGLSYTKAVNREWKRSGPLFESRFKAKLVDPDEYILGLSRYIHLNPVSAHLVEKPEEWPYSNYLDLATQIRYIRKKIWFTITLIM
jgi:putative transposase